MQFFHGKIYDTTCLASIGMKKRKRRFLFLTLFLNEIADFFYGFYGSDFIIGRHEGNKGRVFLYSSFYLLWIYESIMIYRHACYLKSFFFFKECHRFQNGLMF